MEKFVIQAKSEELPPLREKFRNLLRGAGFDQKAEGEVILAADEALTNVIRHSYKGQPGTIEVTVSETPEAVRFSIRDFGPKFDPTQREEPELPRKEAGGLGIMLIKRLMDKVEYDAQVPEGNLLHLTKLKKRVKG